MDNFVREHLRSKWRKHALRRRLLLILLLGYVTGIGTLSAQSKLQLNGHVYDENNNPLEFATVSIPALHVGTHTDHTGAFSLEFNCADSLFSVEFRYVDKATAQGFNGKGCCGPFRH